MFELERRVIEQRRADAKSVAFRLLRSLPLACSEVGELLEPVAEKLFRGCPLTSTLAVADAVNLIERSVLGAKYSPERARQIVKGRSMTQSLLGTAVARIATRSVPGALIVGGGLLAKTLYDRSRNRRQAQAEGEAKLTEQAKNA